jgi:beta-phosphoglucomutase
LTGNARHNVLPEYSAIILDLDGLVIDSEPTYRAAWQSAGKDLGYPLSELLVRGFTGKSYDLIEKLLRAEFGHDFPLEQFRAKSAEVWHESVEQTGIAVKPGLQELLGTLEQRAIPYCLATNSEQLYAEKCLRYAGLGNAFPQRITRDQVAAPKPAPDIFLAAAANLGVNPEQCIVLEDSETGARAALDAGALLMLVGDSRDLPAFIRSRCFAVLESLHEFRQLLVENFRRSNPASE